MNLLAGDIGGTKTIIAAYSLQKGTRQALFEERYPSKKYANLEAILHKFNKDHPGLTFDAAVFGVAGPVIQGKASVTNLPWLMEEGNIRQTFQIPQVKLLNDLASVAHAIPYLTSQEVFTLHAGEAEEHGNIAVIAPGTGLGEAFLTWHKGTYQVHSSEGGHSSFAPTDAAEVRLLLYMMDRFEHVSFERVCSGIGIPNIYAFLKDGQDVEEPEWLRQKLASTSDPTPVIISAALDADKSKRAKICELTLDLFVAILGTESGNLAVKVMATGGIYLGGGIPPRILSALKGGRFLQALHSKGRFSSVMAKIPVQVILNPNAALLGVASYGMSLLQAASA